MSHRDNASFDDVADAFDARQGDLGDRKKRDLLYPHVFSEIRALSRFPVTGLDIGSGNGGFARYCNQRHMFVDGVDSSAKLIGLGRQRDRRLGLRITYILRDVVAESCDDFLPNYNLFTALFVLQDLRRPDTLLAKLSRSARRPFLFFMLNETYFSLTSDAITHTVPRTLSNCSGFTDASQLSFADWGSGHVSVTYCRPDAVYIRLLQDASLSIVSVKYIGAPYAQGQHQSFPFHFVIGRGD